MQSQNGIRIPTYVACGLAFGRKPTAIYLEHKQFIFCMLNLVSYYLIFLNVQQQLRWWQNAARSIFIYCEQSVHVYIVCKTELQIIACVVCKRDL